ncbi:hypothetical protein [Actibacterium sp. 188UL27-1]|uniref:hypothetical protein n=1 Tax=Actibacterium sp. 188UL27-1 TaxID=2786961 RepID=UPI00195D5554|nr:hypothetical protein [Actibacterium sp. 188UL27-1]MBM7068022.1 hypothetical protein [Actibacterium sp. 188UL27-1]
MGPQAEPTKTPQNWLFDRSIGRMPAIGKQVGLAGVVILLGAIISLLINVDAELKNVVPWKGAMFFIVIVSCVIFAVLQKTTDFPTENDLPRAGELNNSMTWAAKHHLTMPTRIRALPVPVVVLSCLILLLPPATFILSLS